jgi:acyl-CoA oxidase
MFADFAVQCTWEGDNTILSLQSGRSLVSSWNDAIRGRKLAPGVSYLSSPDTLTAKSNSSLDLQDIDQGWACIAANVVKKAAEDYAGFLKDGKSRDQAMEMCSQSRFIAAKMHTIGYVSATERSLMGPMATTADPWWCVRTDLPHVQASLRWHVGWAREGHFSHHLQALRLVAGRGAGCLLPEV